MIFYFGILALFIVLYIIFVKVLSSLVKGCLTAVFVVLIIVVIGILIRSTIAPVNVLNILMVDNLHISRIEDK